MMECRSSTVCCTVLHGVQSDAAGFAQLEEQPVGLHVCVQAEGLPPDTALRLLLLSAGEEGAALDLGSVTANSGGILRHAQTYPPIDLHLWDALVLAEDWPSGRLAAAGWLRQPTGPVWRLAEAADRFLSVPQLM